jgi:hypothetical protein
MCLFNCDMPLAIGIENSISNAVNRDWFLKFLISVEIALVSCHSISTTRIINPNVLPRGSFQGSDAAGAICASWGSVLRFKPVEVALILKSCATFVRRVAGGAVINTELGGVKVGIAIAVGVVVGVVV